MVYGIAHGELPLIELLLFLLRTFVFLSFVLCFLARILSRIFFLAFFVFFIFDEQKKMHFHTFDTCVALSTGRRLWPLRRVCVFVWKEELPPNVAQTLSRQSSLEPKKKRSFLNYMSTLLLLLLRGKAIAAAVAAAIAVAAVTAAAE